MNMVCNVCGGDPGIEPSPNATGITCSRCVMKQSAPPEAPKVKPNSASPEEKAEKAAKKEARKTAKLEKMKIRGRGKGWHLKKLFEFDGKFYSFGKEITGDVAYKLKRQVKKEA